MSSHLTSGPGRCRLSLRCCFTTRPTRRGVFKHDVLVCFDVVLRELHVDISHHPNHINTPLMKSYSSDDAGRDHSQFNITSFFTKLCRTHLFGLLSPPSSVTAHPPPYLYQLTSLRRKRMCMSHLTRIHKLACFPGSSSSTVQNGDDLMQARVRMLDLRWHDF